MHRLRVAHVITKLELGGAQRNTLYTVSHLDRSLFEAHLICGAGGILDNEAEQLEHVRTHFCADLVREIRPLQDWKTYRHLTNLLQELKPHIVHTHSSKAGILGRFAAAAAGVPVIIHTYHGFGFHRYQNPVVFQGYVLLEKEACARSHHLVFVSEENQRWAEELGLRRNNGVSLIRSGVQTDNLKNLKRDGQLREELGIPRDVPLIGMLACLKPQKDPLTFVKAAGEVMKSVPEAHFVLAGDGELRDEVLRCVEGLPYPKQFFHLGWRLDTASLFGSIDLLVLTSLWEGLPRVIPEATIAGIPVVASDIDGNREAIYHHQNGCLAPPRNAAAFAENILVTLRESWTVDHELSERFAVEFDIDQMVRRQGELYFKLSSTVAA